MFSLKFCFQNEIHKCSKLPIDFKALVESIQTVFKGHLISSFELQYEDSDGDRIMLSNQEDFESLLQSELNSKSVKIFITPTNKNGSVLNHSIVNESQLIKEEFKESQPVDSYYIIDTTPKKLNESQKMEIKQEQKITDNEIKEVEIKEEVPEFIELDNYIIEAPKEIVEKPIEILEQSNKNIQTQILNTKELSHIEENISNNESLHLSSTQELKIKELIKQLLNEVLSEKLPEITQSILLNSQIHQQQPKENKQETKELKNQKHHNIVICDGCGVSPIVGIRYKCSICPNYDYCENCEATKKHAHPFLKIKDSDKFSQESYGKFQRISSKFEPWKCKGMGEFLNFGIKNSKDFLQNFFNQFENKEECKEQKVSEKEIELESVLKAKTENKVKIQNPPNLSKEISKLYDVVLIKEINSIPEIINPKDKDIYKTISIKNIGILDLPEEVYIREYNNIYGQKLSLPKLEMNKEFSAILRIKSPQKPGKYISQWIIAFKNQFGDEKFIGQPISLNYEIIEIIPEENISKAKVLQELFPGKEFDYYCQVVKDSPKASVEQLIEILLQKQL